MKKPTKPVNSVKEIRHRLWYYISVSEINKIAEELKIDKEKTFIEYECDDYNNELYFVFYEPKLTKEEFQKKLDEYNRLKKEYDKWYKEHGAKIAEEKLEKKKQKQIERLNKQKENIEKMLSKLK